MSGIQCLQDKQEITELCYRYGLTLDRRDWTGLTALFTPDASAFYLDLPPCHGYQAIEDTCRAALKPMSATQHLISNVVVRLDGDQAESTCYLQAQHVRPGTPGGDHLLIAGRYDDLLVRTPDGWRIRERRLALIWTAGNPAVAGELFRTGPGACRRSAGIAFRVSRTCYDLPDSLRISRNVATGAMSAVLTGTDDPAGLDGRIWRTRTIADVAQLVLILALGLTPLGARFVHLIAARGDTGHGALAWLLILGAVVAVGRLPLLWWRQEMRRTRPELFRPRGGPWQRLARAALAATALLYAVLWVITLVLDVRGASGTRPALNYTLAVTAWLLLLIRVWRIRRLPRSDRLSDMVASLPGGPRIKVVSGWPLATANIGVLQLRRPVILVAPPFAAALTDRELRAALAHEVAHVRHGDVRRRIVRRVLLTVCVVAATTVLYHIPALRSLAGLRGPLSVQAGPFLLAVGYLVFRGLRAIDLRAARAEELAADRDGVALSGDQEASADGLGRLSAMLGIPEAWTVPQRLLFASHPATAERLTQLRDPALAGLPPKATSARRVRLERLLTALVVLAVLIAATEVSDHQATAHQRVAMPADAGKYRVLPPRSIAAALLPTETAAAPLDTTSADAVHLRATSVWGSGDLTRFPGAVPVTALYDEEGSSWLYVWGAYGKLADPAGELSAFWSKFVAGPLADVEFPDTEPAGPLGGYLQCDDDFSTCAWADNSGIVVVSLSPPGSQSENIVFVGPPVSEQQLAAMTRSFRAIAEVPAQRAHPPSPAPG